MDLQQYLTFAFALMFVLALIGIVAVIFRRLGLGHAMPGNPRQRRVSIVEVTPLDTRRRLVLLRRDDVEHLILLGTNGDHVIESGIRTGFKDAVAAAAARSEPAS